MPEWGGGDFAIIDRARNRSQVSVCQSVPDATARCEKGALRVPYIHTFLRAGGPGPAFVRTYVVDSEK